MFCDYFKKHMESEPYCDLAFHATNLILEKISKNSLSMAELGEEVEDIIRTVESGPHYSGIRWLDVKLHLKGYFNSNGIQLSF